MFPRVRSLSDVADPVERQQREMLLAEAWTWLRTPYIHATGIKGVGVDCAMLLVRCVVDTGLRAPFDPRPYPQEWHLHKNEERYQAWLAQFGKQVEVPTPGDVVVMRYGRVFSHGGFILNEFQIIHAHAGDSLCEIADMHQIEFKNRAMRFYSLWEK
jgi:cell wall-associated NlpC family hydrolase